ncbi:DUF4214 domain-containing protein [Craurococcus roseus]|uniref:DUF4214 domain-containing protein n=2 Tax=Craurococcus roseus TaxID=77585 RepID=A0ABP3PVI9_9PROT
MAVLAFQADPWAAGPPDAVEYGDPAWFRQGPSADLFGPLAWDTSAERGFDWTDLAFFTKYIHMLRLVAAPTATGFTADLSAYGDAESAVAFSGHDFAYLWPWAGAAAGPSLTGGTVTGFSGTIQGRGGFSITGLSVPAESLKALASRGAAEAIADANDLLLGGDDLITGSGRNDALRAGTGDDTLAGGAGDDRIDGGAGTDTARYGGYRSDYTVAAGAEGGLRIADERASASGDGTDIATGIEVLQFADGRLVFDDADPAAQVARLYEAALDRSPDQAGLDFWVGAVQRGHSLHGLATDLLGCGEFQARFGGAPDDDAFVDRLYQNVLGRAGEQGGRDFWAGSLHHGAGRAEVLLAFSESAENKAGTAALVRNGIWDRSEAAMEVARLYDTVLGRLPDAAGLAAWKDAVEHGAATLAQVADAFAASAEFHVRYGGLDDRGFAEALYRDTLHRGPDQAGLDHWAEALRHGASRAEVALAFSESAEHAVQSEAPPGEYGVLFA